MRSSALLPRLEALGARAGARPESPDFATALTFGDVPAEYEAARTGCALFDETDRGRVIVSGGDAPAFLHRILANDVRGLRSGHGNRNLLLSPKGKVLFDFDLTRHEDLVILSTPPGADEALLEALDTYAFTEDVSFEVTTEGHAPLELRGPAAGAVVERALGPLPELGERESVLLEDGALRVTRKAVWGADGLRLDPGPERPWETWEALVAAGARPAGLVARDSLRVEAGAALFGVDVDENVYPQEARLEDAFDLEKGCYVGQEVVAKIDTYGGLNKRLMALRIDHDDPVPRGTRLLQAVDGEERDLGVVTSWAYSFALDTGLALGYVKRRHQEAGTRFELSAGGTATVVELPVGG